MKTGIRFSAFELFQVDHVEMLMEAKRQCDNLIIELQMDSN